MSVVVADSDFTLHVGDVREVLSTLPDESVHCVVTSPPYWGLRSYLDDGHDDKRHELGLEPTPDLYVQNMVNVFREVRRVLRRDGTCWLNIGDSYVSSPPGNKDTNSSGLHGAQSSAKYAERLLTKDNRNARSTSLAGLKPKDLVGIPWRLAFALQADGWYLRSDIIWAKPAPMPESVRDRPTKSHEYLFLLTKSARYYFDQEAVREPHTHDGRRVTTVTGRDGSLQHRDGERWPNSGRNIRTVWTINAEPFTDWGQTVRQRRVEADAPDGGKKRTTSPDCPVHGDHLGPLATAPDGERGDGSSIRTGSTDAGHAQAPLDELVPTDPRRAPGSAPESLDSPDPAGSPTASARSKGSHKTASRSTSSGTACAETSPRTEGTSPSNGSPVPDGSDSHGSSETHGRTDCTCAWYVEFTEKTSHFATFPQALVEPCVLAGTSERGCCPECGAPWERETEREPSDWQARKDAGEATRHGLAGAAANGAGGFAGRTAETTGWRPTCQCVVSVMSDFIPCTVLDPFMGSGTTALVARRLGRKTIGIELSAEYAQLAATRLQQLSLLAEPA